MAGWRREAGAGRPDLLIPLTSFPESVTSAAEVVCFQQLILVSYLATSTPGPCILRSSCVTTPSEAPSPVGVSPSLGIWVQIFGVPP